MKRLCRQSRVSWLKFLCVCVLTCVVGMRHCVAADTEPPLPRYTLFDADEFAKGTVTDMPVDADSRSNLQSIELIADSSRNCTLKIGVLMPGVTDVTSWSITRQMSFDPAVAVVRFRDAAGNDTVLHLIAKPLMKPVISINGSSRICVGMSRQILTYSRASSYVWNTGDTTPQIAVTPLVSTKYVLHVKNTAGEVFQSDSILISVSTFPDPLLLRRGDTLYVDSNVTALYIQWFCDDVPLSAATQRTLVATKSGTYKVSVTNADLCSKMSNVIVVTGLSENRTDTETGLDLYPLPVEDILNIQAQAHQFSSADIVDSRGEKVMSQSLFQHTGHIELDVRSLAAGQYTLVLVGPRSTTTRSFLKR